MPPGGQVMQLTELFLRSICSNNFLLLCHIIHEEDVGWRVGFGRSITKFVICGGKKWMMKHTKKPRFRKRKKVKPLSCAYSQKTPFKSTYNINKQKLSKVGLLSYTRGQIFNHKYICFQKSTRTTELCSWSKPQSQVLMVWINKKLPKLGPLSYARGQIFNHMYIWFQKQIRTTELCSWSKPR